MFTIRFRCVVLVVIAIATVSLNGCAIDPRIVIESKMGGDTSGGIKFQNRASIISVHRKVSGPNILDSDPKLELQVVAAPYSPDNGYYVVRGYDGFFDKTRLNPTNIPNTKLLNTLSVVLEDKTKDRLETLGSVVGAAASAAMIFLKETGTPGVLQESDILRTFPEQWALDLRQEVKPGTAWIPLSGTIAETPGHWEYLITFQPQKSSSAIAIDSLDMQQTGMAGVFFYSSCMPFQLKLMYSGTTKGVTVKREYLFNDVVANPFMVDTVKLPDKGTVTFGLCSTNVATEATVERNVLELIGTALTQAESVAKKFPKKKEDEK